MEIAGDAVECYIAPGSDHTMRRTDRTARLLPPVKDLREVSAKVAVIVPARVGIADFISSLWLSFAVASIVSIVNKQTPYQRLSLRRELIFLFSTKFVGFISSQEFSAADFAGSLRSRL